ncbi:aldehyde dehydrogenase family protein [Nocardiopsis sp. MG754419]|uniref:aldehyde dehydrogenase family protein n=1 Tax=Nocardiopsis sp. MG754419 TaxID=2259865 RepID=UPI0035B24DA8|nr:hypothetical protein [Nocardiopsis sp. MG754419]
MRYVPTPESEPGPHHLTSIQRERLLRQRIVPTGQAIGTVPRAGGSEVTRAVDGADAAFPGWSTTTADQRTTGLNRMAAVVRENIDDLAAMLTLEQTGRPLVEARRTGTRRL